MYILKEAETPQGISLSTHRLSKIEFIGGQLIATFNSFANETSELVGWQDTHTIYNPLITNSYLDDWVYNWAISSQGCFPGGTLVEDPTDLDLLKTNIKNNINNILNTKFTVGFSVPDGPLQGQILQTTTVEDRTNWLTSQAIYTQQVVGGNGATQGAYFRTKSNETFNITYQEGLDTLNAMAAWGASLMGYSWALKDEVSEAEIEEDINNIDITTGWPT